MRIVRHSSELPEEARGGVVVLGNFDGVHKGHQAVIGAGLDFAKKEGIPCGVMTFEPHPRLLFQPALTPFRLTPLRIKAHIIEALGADFLWVQHFDQDFAAHSAEDFVARYLVEQLQVRHVVAGEDYVFGKKRGGNMDLLRALAERQGFTVTAVAPVKAEGKVFSSTAVREALVAGKPREAGRMLGRFWEMEGRVIEGDKRGRKLGFPTANLRIEEYLPPRSGVYAVRAGIDMGEGTVWHGGVANFGIRPTFGENTPSLEVHLFDFVGDIYHRHLRVALVDFIRPEKKFDGVDALRAQIARDCEKAGKVLASLHLPEGPGPLVPA